MFNHDKFFDKFRPYYKKIRKTKVLANDVVIAVEFLLNKFEQNKDWKDVREIAYAFATIMHETAFTFRPIREFRQKSGTAGRKRQDRYWLTGYYGRGYVQLTWRKNYERAAKKLGIDLIHNPDLALNPEIAFKILTYGMHEGWFTGKKLSTYINSRLTDYFNARRIINGTDKARTIANYAKAFEDMLEYAEQAVEDFVPFVDKTVSSEPTDGTTEIENPQEFDDEGNPIDTVEPEEPAEPKPEEPRIEPEKPIDGYPDEPKPGEPTPDISAKAGEPVTGGRPGDPPVEVPSVEPKPTTGPGAWIANIRAQIASLGIGGFSLASLSFLQDPLYRNIALGFVAVAVIVSVTVYITTIVIKSKEKMKREQWAHEETLMKADRSSDPTKYNIDIVKYPEPQNSTISKIFGLRS